MRVTPVKLVLDLIGERGSRKHLHTWIPASAGMTIYGLIACYPGFDISYASDPILRMGPHFLPLVEMTRWMLEVRSCFLLLL